MSSTISMLDFSGGYATDLAPEMMEDNMLLTAENWFWDSQFQKRGGVSTYKTLTGYSGVMGEIRAYINSNWESIYALDNGTNVTLWHGTSTTLSQVGSETMTTGMRVRMAELNGNVVLVNGTDKPKIIYYDSGFQVQDLEQFDARTREYADWGAGQYDTSAGSYIDDTEDAQDSTADDFEFANASAGDGFYVASPLVFTKIVLSSAQQAAGVVAVYEYYKGSGVWGTATLTQTPDFTAAAGDRTIEFDLPDDWVTYDIATAYIADKYVFRVRFTTAAAAAKYCTQIAVSYTRTITNLKNILGGTEFYLCYQHGNRIWLGNKEGVAYSPNNQVTGWYDYYIEYFAGGGSSLISLISYNDSLMVLKDGSLWTYTGSTYEDYKKVKSADVGCISETGPVVAGGYLLFPSIDGIHIYSSSVEKKISKHIKADYDSYTKTNIASVEYNGYVWMSFPSNGVVLVFDPNTYRSDDMGDGRVSFYKLTSYYVKRFLYCRGDSDTKYLLGVYYSAGTTAVIKRLQDGTYKDGLSGIPVVVQTRYGSQKKYLSQKCYKRSMIDLSKAGDYDVVIYSDDGLTGANFTISTNTGAGHYVEDATMPYELDGRNLSFKLTNNTVYNAKLYGITSDISVRRF